MRHSKRIKGIAAIALAAVVSLGSAGCTPAASGDGDEKKLDYPTRSIDLYIGYGTGGAGDSLAREYARLLEKELGVKVQVLNKPGGSGALATGELLSKPADGYTLALAAGSELSITPVLGKGTLSYSNPDDWTTLGSVVDMQNGILVSSKSPWKTFEDFRKDALARPGEITVGVPSVTGANAMGVASLMDVAGIDVKIVPFSGGSGEAALAVLGGHVDAMNATVSGQLGLIQSGDLISLGHSGDKPHAQVADSKPFSAQGYPISKLANTTYFFYAPADMEKELYDYLVEVNKKIVTGDEFLAWVDKMGYSPNSTGPEESEAALRAMLDDAAEGVRLLTEAGLDLYSK